MLNLQQQQNEFAFRKISQSLKNQYLTRLEYFFSKKKCIDIANSTRESNSLFSKLSEFKYIIQQNSTNKFQARNGIDWPDYIQQNQSFFHNNISKYINKSGSLNKYHISLRGGGCGNSQKAGKTILNPKRLLLPNNFLIDLDKYVNVLTSKANLASDQQCQEDILITLQWFGAMKEHFNTVCQDQQYSSSFLNFILERLPLILQSAISLIKISGFLCLQVLQVCNDLGRIIFSFYLTNDDRFIKVEEKGNILNLIEEFETQLEIESSNIWVAGAEFEIEMIKAAIQSLPSNSDEGKQLLLSFTKELVTSVLSMSPSEGLIQTLIDGAKFLHIAYQTSNLKQKYEIYYFFSSLQWQVINSLRKMDVSVKRILLLISNAYQTHIEKNTDWFLNFCWVKFISFLLIYRPIVYKNSQYQNADLSKNWNSLILNKLVKQFSFDKGCGRILLYQKEKQETQFQLKEILQNLGKEQFILFQDTLLSKLQNSLTKILIFKLENTKIEKQQDYLSFAFCEGTERIELDDSYYYVYELEELINEFKKGLLLKQEQLQDQQQRKLEVTNIKEETNELIERMLYSLHWANKILRKLSFHLETFKLIFSSIDVETGSESIPLKAELIEQIEQINESLMPDCHQQLQQLQEQRISFVQQLSTLSLKHEILLYSKAFQETTSELIEQQFTEIDQCLKIISSFRNSALKVANKISEIKTIYSEKCKQCKTLKVNNPNPSNTITKLIYIANTNQILVTMKQITEIWEATTSIQQQGQEQNLLNKMTQYQVIKYLLKDIVSQANSQREILQSIINFLSIYKKQQAEGIDGKEQTANMQISKNQQIKDMLTKLRTVIESFFQTVEERNSNKLQIDSAKADEILNLIKQNVKTIEEMQKNQESPPQIQIMISIIMVEQIFVRLLKEPNKFGQIHEKINEILKNAEQQFLKNILLAPAQQIVQLEEIKYEEKLQQIEQNQVEELQNAILSNLKFLSSGVEIYQAILEVVENDFQLYQTLWTTTISWQIQGGEVSDLLVLAQVNELASYNKEYIQKELSSLKQFDLQNTLLSIKQEIICDAQPMEILRYFFELLNSAFDSNNQEVQQTIFQSGKQAVKSAIQNLKDSDDNYKVRECFVMNLLQIEAAQLEPEIVSFCQQNILQIWASEQDDRVKNLLKNKEIIELQKKLFSHDLKTFTNKLQLEMKNRFKAMSELEQKIKLEGNMEIKEKQQQLLGQLHQELEEYLDNITDMTAKLDITIIFLKEIKKDLAVIKSKIDKLQDTVNDIGNDLRKLRGKPFIELLKIRKSKVLTQKQFRDLNSIYIPLKVQEYDTKTGQVTNIESFLLKDDFLDNLGEVNEFLVKEIKIRDVMLLKGLAGSGKSRAAAKIEEFLWEKNDLGQSDWIPVYVSLPTLKEPRFNLLDQGLESEFYQFDKIQIKEFQDVVRKRQLKVVLILDSYDEMKQEFIESNLYLTNRFSANLLENDSNKGQVSEHFKVIITTRSEILTSSTSYQTWFYGKSLESLKEIEIKGFNENQQQKYLEQYTFITVKKELYELYEFVKHATQEKIDLFEFNQFWKKIEQQLIASQYSEINHNQGYLLNEEKANEIILISQKENFFQNISSDQIINLTKRLLALWSSSKYEDIISKVNIRHILTTPFMMEIMVQVLPSMIQKYSDGSTIKRLFLENFLRLKQQLNKEQYLIKLYRNRSNKMIAEQEYKVTEEENQDLKKSAKEKWDLLDQNKFFQQFSIVEQIDEDKLLTILKSDGDTSIVIRALKIKALTVFDFYSAFTEFYHNRSIQKLREQGKALNYEAFTIDLSNFSQSLALDLTIHELAQIKYDAKGQLTLTHIKNNVSSQDDWKALYFNDFQKNGEYIKLIRSCTLLTLKGSSHSFTHKSIQEFYVASYLLKYLYEVQKALQSQELDEQELYNKDEFNISKDHFNGALVFLKEKMKEYKELPKQLIEIVKLSAQAPKYKRAASNSLFLLSFNREYLGNLQFNNINIADTNLFGLSLYNSNLEESKFENVNISFCNFNRSNLKNVKWNSISCNELPQLLGHTDQVESVAFSPDGKILASGSKDKTIRFWDIKVGKDIAKLIGHEKTVQTITFSPDSQILASSSDATIRLWDVKSQKQFHLLEGHKNDVFSLSFSPDGQTLASGSKDKTIQLWDVKTWKQFCILEGHTSFVNSICFSSDGSKIASGSSDVTAILWDFKTKKKIAEFVDDTFIKTIAFSPDGSIIASGNDLWKITLWDIKTRKQLAILEGHTSRVLSLAFSPDGQMLASSSYDETIRLWDVKAQKQQTILEGHINSVQQIAFSPDGQILASGSYDKTVRLWDVKAGKQLIYLDGHTQKITTMAFSPDGSILASGSEDYNIRLWDVQSGKQLALLEGHIKEIFSVSFSNNGQILASTSNDQTIRLWNVKEGTQTLFSDQVYYPRAVAFSLDDQIFATSSDRNTILLWDSKTRELLTTLEGHKHKISSLVFLPDCQTLASGSYDKTIRLWDFKAYKLLSVLEGHTKEIYQITISNDGQTLASASEDQTIRLWDLKVGKELVKLEGHNKKHVLSVAFAPDGQTLASGGRDNTIKIWDLKTYKLIQTLGDHKDQIYSVSFSPDGQFLASGSTDKTIRLWDVKAGYQCWKILGKTQFLSATNCQMAGAHIISDIQINLTTLLKQRGAVDILNV